MRWPSRNRRRRAGENPRRVRFQDKAGIIAGFVGTIGPAAVVLAGGSALAIIVALLGYAWFMAAGYWAGGVIFDAAQE